MIEPQGTGDCFVVAAGLILECGDKTSYTLVHGKPLGRGGAARGLRYWHAWIEAPDGTVLDMSNGLSVRMAQETYYMLGSITTLGCRRYSYPDAVDHMRRYRHYGPWDSEHPPAPEFRGKWVDDEV